MRFCQLRLWESLGIQIMGMGWVDISTNPLNGMTCEQKTLSKIVVTANVESHLLWDAVC